MTRKSILLGTSALAGATLLAAPAHAGGVTSGDNYQVTLGGRYDNSAIFTSQDRRTGTGRGYRFTSDQSEIYIGARARADNGISYGVNVELQATGENIGNADEAWAFIVSDSWGRVEMGEQDSAAERMHVAGEDILAGRGGWDSSELSDTISAGNAFISADNDSAGDATKLIYFSPRLSGFQVGGSFTPDTSAQGRSVPLDNTGTVQNLYSLGLNYVGEFDNFGLTVTGTYEGGQRDNVSGPGSASAEDDEIWAVGTIVTFGAFEVAAGYVDWGSTGLTSAQDAAGQDAGKQGNAAIAYSFGSWKVSGGFYYSEKDNGAAGNAKTSIGTLNATYNVAPGWAIDGDLNYVDIEKWSATQDNKATQFIVANRFQF